MKVTQELSPPVYKDKYLHGRQNVFFKLHSLKIYFKLNRHKHNSLQFILALLNMDDNSPAPIPERRQVADVIQFTPVHL